MGRPPRPDLRDALLEAARAEFADHGLERARVEDIARRAGASKGAFYLHFASKEEAFEEILQRFMGAMEDQARGREEAEVRFKSDPATLSDPGGLGRQVDFDCQVDLPLLEALWRNRQILPVIDSERDARFRRTVDDFRRRMHALVSGRMAEKQAAGLIRRDVDPTVLADILVGTWEGFARRAAHVNDRPDLEGWLRSFTRILYEGMLERSSRAPPPSLPPAPSPRSGKRRRTGS